jgi:acetoin utilization deacetylase AcuC-like enzyme
LQHVPPPGHPDGPERLHAVLEAVERHAAGRWSLQLEAPIAADDHLASVLRWIHDPDYLDTMLVPHAADRWAGGADNPVRPGTSRAVLSAAGVTLAGSLELCNERLHRGFLAVRPPGHLAGAGRALGYCYCATAALAAEVITRAWHVPVLIVDFDHLHGVGTQEMFYDRPDVGYLSVHEYPGLTGSGGGDEVGVGEGRGSTRNIPLAAGADDTVFATAVEDGLEQLGSRLRPAVVLVCAGFGAHIEDPVGQMRVTERGFARAAGAIVAAANTWSQGRVLALLEGGFNPPVLANSVVNFLEQLAPDGSRTS